ncbi:XRE family transcriptional regulator [Corynebacterium propinquum]|uniref:XRE family transcriptional regulator n=1 Tax=Corynebacterium propinquum TaxID=43769 RepID=UPI002541C909|nr:XRE family transcriptional regulator [Corynebacterium propinquum]MDK4235771.1 XRE family transcriptional regulator [Corynebacterium propinquum]
MFLLSLDEIDRVKRLHHITSTTGLAEKTNLARKTWTTAINTRKPTVSILEALATLGANPSKVLVVEELAA